MKNIQICSALALCFMLANCTREAGNDSTGPADETPEIGQNKNQLPLPSLKPVTTAKARLIAAYGRKLQNRPIRTEPQVPTAWSMVNVQCQDRAKALQWALAEPPPLQAPVSSPVSRAHRAALR